MDDPNLSAPAPKVEIVSNSFLQSTQGKLITIIGISILLFILVIIILNYLRVISLTQLSFLPKKSVSTTSKLIEVPITPEAEGFRAGELTFKCPLESKFCSSSKLQNTNSSYSISYKASSSSAVLNITKIPSLDNIAVSVDEKAGKKYFYESVLSKNTSECYTILYTLPYDAVFANI